MNKYMQTNKVTVPIVADMGQMTISYINAKPGQSHLDVPHLFLIDKQGMIRNDFQYNDSTKFVFEGPGLFPEIEKLLSRFSELGKSGFERLHFLPELIQLRFQYGNSVLTCGRRCFPGFHRRRPGKQMRVAAFFFTRPPG